MDRHGDERAGFRFVYMSQRQEEHQLPRATLQKLATRLTAPGPGTRDSDVPAGYTYLGQFIAHDLSFDLTTAGLGRRLSLRRLQQAASPSLDLDSLYGAGPMDPDSARFYVGREGPRMLTGRTEATPGHPAFDGCDLPRGSDGDPRKALIADPRNDDNLAVAQTHAALLRFHNRVADELTTAGDPPTRHEQARDIVTRHFQWIVWHDFLPRICDPAVLADVLENGRKAFEPGVDPGVPSMMPLEFSTGVFRLGHSMVRSVYDWNRSVTTISLDDLFRFSGRGGDLGGHEALPSTHAVDFRRLYDFAEADRRDLRPPRLNRARWIDTRLTHRLRELPPGTFGAADAPLRARDANLAFRNLMKARSIALPSGQDMAEFLASKGVELEPLTRETISRDADGTDTRLAYALGEAGLRHTPLWVYALREAERAEPHRLNNVGARIVAETFHRAIESSRISIFDGTGWTPTLRDADESFSMAHLLLFAFARERALLAPLEPDAPE